VWASLSRGFATKRCREIETGQYLAKAAERWEGIVLDGEK
jgi:hypothetical protein